MLIEGEPERYIDDIVQRGLNDINRVQLDDVLKIFGRKMFIQPGRAEMECARAYIQSPIKRKLDYVMGKIALTVGGQYIINRGMDVISQATGKKEFFTLAVGFLGQEPVSIPKIPTMREGAEYEIQNPFDTTSLVGGKEVIKDERILEPAEGIRRRSIDEFPQFYSLKDGVMTAIGIRAYTAQENQATAILESLKDNPKVCFSPEVKDILSVYRSQINFFKPKPAIVSYLSAYLSKDTDHWVRLMLDLGYLWHASPKNDIYSFILTMRNRVAGSVGAR